MLVRYFTDGLSLAAALLAALTVLPRAWAQALGDPMALNFGSDPRTLSFFKDAVGVRAGAFHLFPSAALSLGYDSNLFAAPAPRNEDALAITEALLHAESDPNELQIKGDAFVRERNFLDERDQDTTEFGAATTLAARPDVQDELSGRVLAQRRFESRTDIETPHGHEVSFYKELRGDASYLHTFNRFAIRTTAVARRLDYEESAQQFRDRTYYRGELQGAYELHSGFALLGVGYYSQDDFRHSSALVFPAHTTGAQLGARYSIMEIAELQLTAGYFERHFEQGLGSISGLSLRGSMTLHPSRLSTVHAEVLREDAPTRIPGAFGKIRTGALIDISHDYSRTLNLYARGTITVDDFDTIDRTDRTVLAATGAIYQLSRRYIVSGEYEYATRHSASIGESFVQHVARVSLIGRF